MRGLRPEQGCCATGKEHVEDGGVNKTIIQQALVGMAEFERIGLAQVRKKCLAVVNMVMNFQVLQNAGNFMTT
jgi:hypothetical protein